MIAIRSVARRVVPLTVRRPLGHTVYRLRIAAKLALRESLGRLPLLAARDFVYNDHYYAKTDPWKLRLYERFADALVRLRDPSSVVDVGCGSGLMLRALTERGVRVTGIEGSRAAIRRSHETVAVVRANLERGVPAVGRFDACLCIEVAEHLSARAAVRLVRGLTELSDVVVFTAAPPGQGGTAHMNERPRAYWESLFAANGFLQSPLEGLLREAIADIPEPDFLHRNLMVFERGVLDVATGTPR